MHRPTVKKIVPPWISTGKDEERARDEDMDDGPHHLAMIGDIKELSLLHQQLPKKRWEKEVLNKKADWTVSADILSSFVVDHSICAA
jgi:hypothetical protein